MRDSFGFKFVSGKERPRHIGDGEYYISKIDIDSPAYIQKTRGLLCEKDTIYAVSGQLVRHFNTDELAAFMRSKLVLALDVVNYDQSR